MKIETVIEADVGLGLACSGVQLLDEVAERDHRRLALSSMT